MRTYKIKDIGKVVTGKTPPTKIEEYYTTSDYMFVCPPDIKNKRYIFCSEKYISDLAFNTFKAIQLDENSIVIDCIGADLGNVSIIGKKCITNQQINAITKINNDTVIPLYLYYYFLNKKDYFHLIGQNGSTMPIINKSLFENIEISIHSIEEQQHIVNTISFLLLKSL